MDSVVLEGLKARALRIVRSSRDPARCMRLMRAKAANLFAPAGQGIVFKEQSVEGALVADSCRCNSSAFVSGPQPVLVRKSSTGVETEVVPHQLYTVHCSPLTLLPELQVIRERSITLLKKSTNPGAVLDRFKNGIKRSFEGLLDPESHLRVFQVAEKMADAVEAVVDCGNVKLPVMSSSVSLPISMPLGCSNLCPMAAENSMKAKVMVLAVPASREFNPVAAAGQPCGSKDFARNKAVHSGLQRPLLDVRSHVVGSDSKMNWRSSLSMAVAQFDLGGLNRSKPSIGQGRICSFYGIMFHSVRHCSIRNNIFMSRGKMHISAQEIVPTRYGEWMTNAELIPQFSEQQGEKNTENFSSNQNSRSARLLRRFVQDPAAKGKSVDTIREDSSLDLQQVQMRETMAIDRDRDRHVDRAAAHGPNAPRAP